MHVERYPDTSHYWTQTTLRLTLLCISMSILFCPTSRASTNDGVPVFTITPVESSVKFDVEASVAIRGTFENGTRH